MKKMKNIVSNKILFIILFFLITSVHLVSLIYWKDQKSNYYVDEYFSMEDTKYYFSPEDNVYINELEDWVPEEWMEINDLQSVFIIQRDDNVLDGVASLGIKKMICQQNYFLILNIIVRLTNGYLNITDSAIIFNIFSSVLIAWMLMKLVYDITESLCMSAIATVLYCFASITISLVEYVRFYEYCILGEIIFIYLHYIIWNEKRWYINILIEIVVGILVIIMMYNQILFMIFAAIWTVVFELALLKKGEFPKAILYGCPIFFLGIWFCTSFIEMALNYRLYPKDAWIYTITNNSLHPNLEDICNNCKILANYLWRYFFGSRIALLFWGLVIVGAIAIKFVLKYKIDNTVLFAYICGIVQFVYELFLVYVGIIKNVRYSCFLLIPMIVFMVVGLFSISKDCRNDRMKKVVILFGVVVSIYSGVKVQKTRYIDNIYHETAHLWQILDDNEYNSLNSIILHNVDENGMGHLYECIYHMNSDSLVYYYTGEGRIILTGEDYIVWTHKNNDDYLNEIDNNEDYLIEYVGSTHISDIYIARNVKKMGGIV